MPGCCSWWLIASALACQVDRTSWFDLYPNIDLARKVEAPVFVIHGTQDQEVPVEHGVALAEAALNAYKPWFVEGAGHNNIEVRFLPPCLCLPPHCVRCALAAALAAPAHLQAARVRPVRRVRCRGALSKQGPQLASARSSASCLSARARARGGSGRPAGRWSRGKALRR